MRFIALLLLALIALITGTIAVAIEAAIPSGDYKSLYRVAALGLFAITAIVLVAELSNLQIRGIRLVLVYCKHFIEIHWLLILHVICISLLIGVVYEYISAIEVDDVSGTMHKLPAGNLIAISALYIAGVQATLAMRHYQSSTKRQMRQATLEHARFAILAVRTKERELFHAMARINKKTKPTSHPLYLILAEYRKGININDRDFKLIIDSMRDYGRRSAIGNQTTGQINQFTPRYVEHVPEIICDILERSLTGSMFIREMLLPYEMLAVGVMRKSFGFVSINAMIGPHLVHTYRRWELFICLSRRGPGQSAYFDCYQFLVSSIIQFRANDVLQRITECHTRGDAQIDGASLWWVLQARKRKYFPVVNISNYSRRQSSKLCELIDELYGIDHVSGTRKSSVLRREDSLLITPQKHPLAMSAAEISDSYHRRVRHITAVLSKYKVAAVDISTTAKKTNSYFESMGI